MCPVNAPTRNGTTEEAPQPRLSLTGFPKLQALVEGPGGEEILAELRQLSVREPNRATRYHRDLFARIRAGDDQPPEVAIVRDLSRSGVRLQLTASAHLDVVRSRTITIEMRRPGAPFVTCQAKLVRVIDHHKGGAELAFTFVRRDDEQDSALEALLTALATDAAAAG